MLLKELGKYHTFQTFDDSPRKRPALVRTLHGTLEEHEGALHVLNSMGAGVFFTVNETDGKGRKNENIVRVRALFADFDTVNHERLQEMLLAWDGVPSCIVESSPGKHHTYWLLSDSMPLNVFSASQKLIAHAVGSDPKICDLARVMRVPGFYHMKGEPFPVREIYPQGAE